MESVATTLGPDFEQNYRTNLISEALIPENQFHSFFILLVFIILRSKNVQYSFHIKLIKSVINLAQ